MAVPHHDPGRPIPTERGPDRTPGPGLPRQVPARSAFALSPSAQICIAIASLSVLALVGAAVVLGKDVVIALSTICLVVLIGVYWLFYA